MLPLSPGSLLLRAETRRRDNLLSRKKLSNIPMAQTGIVTLGGAGTASVANVTIDPNARIILSLNNAVASAQELAYNITQTSPRGLGTFNVSSSAGALAEGALVVWWIHNPAGNPAQG